MSMVVNCQQNVVCIPNSAEVIVSVCFCSVWERRVPYDLFF